MGISRKIQSGMKRKIAMVDSKLSINDCMIFLGHPNASHASASAEGFKAMLPKALARARCVNLADIYSALNGVHKSLWN